MFRLVGYLSDVAGMQSELFTVPPVVRDEAGVLWVGHSDGWFPEEATRLDPVDIGVVTDLSSGIEIQVGQAIWMIGSNAHSTISSVIDEPSLRREMVRWDLAPLGFRWKLGSRAEFLDFSQYIADQSRVVLRRWLSGVESEAKGRLATRLYSTLENVEEHRRLPLLGVVAARDLRTTQVKLLAAEFRSVVPLWRWILAPFSVRLFLMEARFRRRASHAAGRPSRPLRENEVLDLTASGLIELLSPQARIGSEVEDRWRQTVMGLGLYAGHRPNASNGDWRESSASSEPWATSSTDEIEAYANGSRR